jgi:hypothetical protein
MELDESRGLLELEVREVWVEPEEVVGEEDSEETVVEEEPDMKLRGMF